MTASIPVGAFEPLGFPWWHDEVRRAVAYLVWKNAVEPAAAGVLEDAVAVEFESMRARVLAKVPDRPAPGKLQGAAPLQERSPAELRAWMDSNDAAREAEHRALWGHPRDEEERLRMLSAGGLRDMAPLDAVLVARLEEIGATARAEEAADGARKAIRDAALPPHWRWRTYHRTLRGLVECVDEATTWPPRGTGWRIGAGEGVPDRLSWWLETKPDGTPLVPHSSEETRTALVALWDAGAARNAAAPVATPNPGLSAFAWLLADYAALPFVRDNWVPPARLVALALALWEHAVKAKWEERQRSRRAAGGVPALHPVVRSILAGSGRGALVETDRGAVDLIDAEGGEVRGWINPAAAVSLPDGRLAMNPPSVVPMLLAGVLARMVWAAASHGEECPRIVTLGASKHELERLLGVRCTEDELDAAIDFLRSVAVAGRADAKGRPREDWHLIERASAEKRIAPGGGRPSLVRVIHCGFPLAPWALKRSYQQLGVSLPPELRFPSGVLDPATVPVTGDKRTRGKQRVALALGLPAWLVERHREEYAERGGVRLGAQDVRLDWESYAKNEWGLYVRSHASLPETLLQAAVAGTLARGGIPNPWLPGMPGAPVMVETERGSGVYRMADEGQHALLTEAGGKTVVQRARRVRGLEREQKRLEKAQRPRPARKKG